MEKHISIGLMSCLAASVCLTGCMSPTGRPDYTASGALAGGATGAIVGSMGRHPGSAPLVGAAVGAVIGGLIGHGMDQDQEAQLRAQAPQTLQRVEQSQPLTVPDVKALAGAGISDDLIISQIRNSRVVYRLSTAEIIDLKDSGVSQRVIDFMINTPSSIGGTSQAAPASQTTTYVTVPPPPPPVERVVIAPAPGYVWIDGEWIWDGRWVWMAGYWGVPPYPHAVWVRGSWDREPRGWHGTRGHWRR